VSGGAHNLSLDKFNFMPGQQPAKTANWRPQHFSVGAAIQILFNFLSPSILLEPLLWGEGTPPNVHIGTFALLTQLYNAFWRKGMGGCTSSGTVKFISSGIAALPYLKGHYNADRPGQLSDWNGVRAFGTFGALPR